MELSEIIEQSHARSKAAGWWTDPITGLSLIPGVVSDMPLEEGEELIISSWFPYVVGTKIALIHSEISEGLEAYRTDAMDDKLPRYRGIAVEMTDAIIRIGDLMGMLREFAQQNGGVPFEYDMDSILADKWAFNASRSDHILAARAVPGGKKF